MLLYQSLYDLTDRTVCNLKSVLVLINTLGRNTISVLDLTNSLGRNLISVLNLTNPLGRRMISALVPTSHLKCQAILLILLCLAAPFLTAPGCFCLASLLLMVICIEKCPGCFLKSDETISLVIDRIFPHLILSTPDKFLSKYSQRFSAPFRMCR